MCVSPFIAINAQLTNFSLPTVLISVSLGFFLCFIKSLIPHLIHHLPVQDANTFLTQLQLCDRCRSLVGLELGILILSHHINYVIQAVSENHWKDKFQTQNHGVSWCFVIWDTHFFKCCDWRLVVKEDGLKVQKTCRGWACELSSWISLEMLANFNFCVKFSGHSYFFLKS